MSKVTKQNKKLKHAIIVSIVLHTVLIIFLVYSSFVENIDAIGAGSNINAVMVDLGEVMKQHNRQQNKTKNSEPPSQKRTEEIQKKQDTKKLGLKQIDIEKDPLRNQEEAEKRASEQKKATYTAKHLQLEQKQAQAADGQKKVAVNSEKKAKVKVKAVEVAEKIKAAATNAKAKVIAEKKAATDQAPQEPRDMNEKDSAATTLKKKVAAKSSDVGVVGDLLGDLTSEKNAPLSDKATGGIIVAAEQIKQKKLGASDVAIDSYLSQVKGAIQSKFYDADAFAGKTCDIHIKLAPDGLLISATPAGGDQVLCLAAINAARTAKIPKPPSQDIWQVVKEATVEFKP